MTTILSHSIFSKQECLTIIFNKQTAKRMPDIKSREWKHRQEAKIQLLSDIILFAFRNAAMEYFRLRWIREPDCVNVRTIVYHDMRNVAQIITFVPMNTQQHFRFVSVLPHQYIHRIPLLFFCVTAHLFFPLDPLPLSPYYKIRQKVRENADGFHVNCRCCRQPHAFQAIPRYPANPPPLRQKRAWPIGFDRVQVHIIHLFQAHF